MHFSDPVGIFNHAALEAERCALAVGWRDPVALNDAAYLAGLTGGHFAIPEHGVQFAYLCTCAELDRLPDPAECQHLAWRAAGIRFSRFMDDLDETIWCDHHEQGVFAYVDAVRDYARQQRRLAELLRQAGTIIDAEFQIVAVPRRTAWEQRNAKRVCA